MKPRPSSGTSFHSLQATSHALQPMQSVVSVKKPDPLLGSSPPARRAARIAELDRRPVHAVAVRSGPAPVAGDELRQPRSARAPARRRMSQVAALASWMWTFGSSTIDEQVVGGVAACRARGSPSGRAGRPGGRCGPATCSGAHPLGDQHPRLDRRARRDDRRPAAVLEPALGGELGADLAEHLRLELGEVRDGAAHRRRRCGARSAGRW